MSASKLGVEVGSHNLYEDDPDQQSFAVAEVGLHEDYNSFNINNDICMLALDGTISMGANVGTISIPYSMEESRQCSSDTTGTSTFWRTRAKLPPSVVVPHPLTVQMVPSSYSSML